MCSGTEAESYFVSRQHVSSTGETNCTEQQQHLSCCVLSHLHGGAGSCRLTDRQKKTFFFA